MSVSPQLQHSTWLDHSHIFRRASLSTPATLRVSAAFSMGKLAYVVVQVSRASTVGVTVGQQAAGQDSVVSTTRIHSGVAQTGGGSKHLRVEVDVTVGQYGCTWVVIMTGLRPVV